MKISSWGGGALLMAGLLTGGLARETLVSPAPGLTGAWVVPDEAWDGRAVLLFHGMASDMDDVGDLLKHAAEGLAEQGIASLRINFRGEGDRMRTRIESTLFTRLEDAAAAHAWVSGQPGVQPARIGVLGFSLGATTAIVTAGRQPAWFKSMAVWSSPSGDQFAGMGKNETAQTALRDGEATEDIPGWKKLTTKREFYESFRGCNVDESLAKYPGAFLAVRGSADFLPPHEKEFMTLAHGRPTEAVIIGGADHIYSVFQPELGHATRVLAVTVAWFERTL